MTKEEAKRVLSVVANEGFDYTFVSKTGFQDIKDDVFHRLRKKYLEAQEELEEFLLGAAGITCLEDLEDS